jgi:hypothetical protein
MHLRQDALGEMDGRSRAWKDELRGWVRAVVAEGEVFSIEAEEEKREDEEHDQGGAEQKDDTQKVGRVGWKLLNLHARLDARGARLGAFFDLGAWRLVQPDR